MLNVLIAGMLIPVVLLVMVVWSYWGPKGRGKTDA